MTSFAQLRARSRAWYWQAALGVLLLVLGVFALLHPFASSLALGVYLGWALIVSGAFGIAAALRTMRMRGHALDAYLGVLSVAAGLVMLAYPLAGALAALWAVGIWLALSGVTRLFVGGRARHERVSQFAAGILDLVLALLLFIGFVTADLFLVATMLGVSLIVASIVTFGVALRLRELAHRIGRSTLAA